MKKILLLLLILSCTPHIAKASHAGGGYFEYTCIDINTYEVTFNFLRDCSGIAASDELAFVLSNSCGEDCNLTFLAPRISIEEVNFGCGNACSGGTVYEGAPSYQFLKYRTVVSLPYPCADWRISVSISTRNDVDYTANASSFEYYNYCMINNTTGFCNTSTQVSGWPFALGCANGLGSSMYSFVNPDGNTVTYSLVDPLNGFCWNNFPVSFVGGTSAQMPFPSQGNFVVSPTGELSFAPTAVGQNYFAILVREYNGADLVGSVTIDGLVFVSAYCNNNNTISFGAWNGDTDLNLETGLVDSISCASFSVSPTEVTGTITNINVSTGQYSTLDYITYNPDGSATIGVCFTFPSDLPCEEITEYIDVTTTATGVGGCVSQVAGGVLVNQTYSITKVAGNFCPDYLYFTNRNSSTGIPMPVYAQATSTIWVGDDMPPPPQFNGIEGQVEISTNVTLVAGNQIILPSCLGGGSGCITIDPIYGNVDLLVQAVNCGPECPYTPMTVTCEKLFNCWSEKIIANVTGGIAPYIYVWYVDGQVFVTNNNELSVYGIVSGVNGNIDYSVTVFDDASQEQTCYGSLLGTKRFYENIRNSTEYYSFQNGSVFGDPGYYYDGTIYITDGSVSYNLPNPFSPQSAHIYDGVNYDVSTQVGTPPYYGAINMDFTIWNGYGVPIVQETYNIENSSDWSIDNFSINWNGYNYNNPNLSCAYGGGSGDQAFNYRLIATNCVSNYVPNPPVTNPNPGITEAHIENAMFIILDGCYDDGITPIPAGMQVNDPGTLNSVALGIAESFERQSENVVISGNLSESLENRDLHTQISCVPNPATESFSVLGNVNNITALEVFDESGKIVLTLTDVQVNQEIQIGHLDKGIYQIRIILTDSNDKTFKLVKL